MRQGPPSVGRCTLPNARHWSKLTTRYRRRSDAAGWTHVPKCRLAGEEVDVLGGGRRWAAAVREHEAVVSEFLRTIERIGPAEWSRTPSPDRWSPAAVALHVCISYELGRDAANGVRSMRLRSAPPIAWLSRTLLLPLMFATKRFPRNAPAPREVRPDLDEAARLGQPAIAARLGESAAAAAAALRDADGRRPTTRFTHAYFGSLSPLATLRLLSAHTRHHARRLAAALPFEG